MNIRSVIVDPAHDDRLVIEPAILPAPRYDEVLVRVKAVSLNRGEVKKAHSYAPSGWRPGWDFAGIVERAAENGAGPKAGDRVVGLVREGAWAEYVIAPAVAVAVLPDNVGFAQAATMPVAGLTALHALRQGGMLLGRNLLITGATGGVGDFAIQLAALSGARITALVRRPEQAALVTEWGAHHVVVGDSLVNAANSIGSFDLIIDSVGGKVLADSLAMLSEGGVCVNLGVSSGSQVTFDAATFFLTGRAKLYGLILFDELKSVEPASLGLATLARLVESGKLKPHISIETGWEQVADVARQLIDRRYTGKAVLTID